MIVTGETRIAARGRQAPPREPRAPCPPVFLHCTSASSGVSSNGENRQYAVPADFKFTVEGKQLSAMELRPGMKVTGTKIVEEPTAVITQDVVVTGTAPK